MSERTLNTSEAPTTAQGADGPAMLSIVPSEMEQREAYRLLIGLVVPRPIGWISTIGSDGTHNLAPFSFFNVVAGNPLTLMISVGNRRPNNSPKDTLRNARDTGELVANIVTEHLVKAMNHTSGEWPHGVDEFQEAHLTTIPSTDVRPPRVAEAAAALEGKVTQIIPVEGSESTMILARVVRIHVRADLFRPNGQIDPTKLRPVARLSGDEYTTIGDIFELTRPKV